MDETMDKDAAGPSLECANPWPHLATLFPFSEYSDNFLNVKLSSMVKKNEYDLI